MRQTYREEASGDSNPEFGGCTELEEDKNSLIAVPPEYSNRQETMQP